LEAELDGNIAENFEEFIHNLTVDIDVGDDIDDEDVTNFDCNEFEILLARDQDEI